MSLSERTRDALPDIFRWLGFLAVVVGMTAIVIATANDVGHNNRETAATEAAAAKALTARGEHVDSIDCTVRVRDCLAIIDGTTYLVTIQTTDDGKKVYGLSDYTVAD